MYSESQCRFCAKLPVVHHHARTGTPTRCPLCKGQLIEDRGSGTTYRFEETSEAIPARKSLGRKLAALFGISATAILIWLLVKPHVPEKTVAAAELPVVRDSVDAQAELSPISNPGEDTVVPVTYKSGTGMATLYLRAKPPAGETEIASKPYSAKGVAKNRPLYADGFYSRAKDGTYMDLAWAIAARTPWREFTEAELLVQLQAIPQVGLAPKTDSAFREPKKSAALDHAAYLADLKRSNPEAKGLPFQSAECQLSKSATRDFLQYAVGFRAGLDSLGKDSVSSSLSDRRGSGNFANLVDRYNRIKERFEPSESQAPSSMQRVPHEKPLPSHAVAALQQLMMDQDKVIRRVLISYLEEMRDRQATAALAKRALFDLDAGNRNLAVQALKDLPAEEYTPILLEGLRYPYPPVAHNAALALATLKRSDLVPKLVVALNQPDPDLPFTEAGVWKVRELVRVNHHRNCLMCHAASYSDRDSVRVSIPSPDKPLPRPFSVDEYCSDASIAVRPDVTYLRQDFSALMEVPNPGKWRSTQRFDFLIRVREVNKDELASLQKQSGPEKSGYKQAIIFALRELTGTDAGMTASAWRQRLAQLKEIRH